MAKYEVLSAAWTRTKDGEVIYLSQQNQDQIPDRLTKTRIKELVDGQVLREVEPADPEEVELAALATKEAVVAEADAEQHPRGRGRKKGD